MSVWKLILLMANQYTKFEISSLSHSRDILGELKCKMGHVTWPRPFQGQFVVHRLRHAMMNLLIEHVLPKLIWEERVATHVYLHLIHPSLDRPHSPLQTAAGTNQPFYHNTFSGPTDRPTDRIGNRSVRKALTLYYIDRERRANNKLNLYLFDLLKNMLYSTSTRNRTSGVWAIGFSVERVLFM